MKGQWEPQRQCAGCMQRRPQREMLRVVKQPGGAVVLDTSGHADGRGAYVCSAGCAGLAWKKKRLSRILRCEVPFEIYEAVQQMLNRE